MDAMMGAINRIIIRLWSWKHHNYLISKVHTTNRNKNDVGLASLWMIQISAGESAVNIVIINMDL